MSHTKVRAALRSSSALAAVSGLLLLAACSESGNSPFGASDKGTAEKSAPKQVAKANPETDIKAPELFEAEEAGLWDGRPSLGGIWVAHPDVNEPQRVLIRNEANGREITGALFRRQRDVPGPRIQASSDAAEALGMLAGAPVKLNVIALVREEPKAEQAAEQAEELLPAPQEEREVFQVSQAATGALDTPALPNEPEPEIVPVLAENTAEEPLDVPETTVLAAEAPVPQPKSRLRWPWQKKPSIEDEILSDGAPKAEIQETQLADIAIPPADFNIEEVELVRSLDEPVEEEANAADFAPRRVKPEIQSQNLPVLDQDRRIAAAVSVVLSETPARVASLRPDLSGVKTDVGQIEREALRQQGATDPVVPTPALIGPSPNQEAGQIVEPALKASDAQFFEQETAQSQDASDLNKPYIQIGVFGVKDNATRTAQVMQVAGVTPQVLPTKSSGKPAWRVVVGPAATQQEQDDMLQKVQGTGFKDAYTVTN